ncbi:MAG: alpha/beta fold hydrolase [Miltoncostaeaceae bacterium]
MNGDIPGARRERIDCGGAVLSVQFMGPDDGEPVIMWHGFPEMGYSWRHQAAALAADGYRTIVPDLRGYGESDRPTGTDAYAFPQLVGDVVGLINALGHGYAHLAGHDWGGSLCWATSALMPDKVRSLMILNAPHPVASAECRQVPEQQQKSWYMLLFQFEGVAEKWLLKDGAANLSAFVFDTAAPGTFGDEERRVFTDALMREGAMTAALEYYRANIPPRNWLKPPPDLPPVTVPTTIMWADADAYMTPLLLERSITKVEGPLEVVMLEGVSHWAQQEAPDLVNAAMRDHLARTR